MIATTRVESRGAWSPDGKSIAFNSDRLGDMNLWLHAADGSDRQLTRGPGGDYQPNWAADGKTIAFFSSRAGQNDIWTVDVADGTLHRLTSTMPGSISIRSFRRTAGGSPTRKIGTDGFRSG